MLTIKLALAYFKHRKIRVILTVLGIIVAIASLTSVYGLNGTLTAIQKEIVGHLGGRADLELKGSIAGIEDNVLKKVENIEGVKTAIPFNQVVTSVKGIEDLVLIMGINSNEDIKIRNYIFYAGRMPTKGKKEICISKVLSDIYSLKIGDILEVQGTNGYQGFRIVGIIEDNGIGKINNGLVSLIPLDISQDFFDMKNKYSYISLMIDNPKNLNVMMGRIEAELGNGVNVRTPQQRGADLDNLLRKITIFTNNYAILILLLALYIVYNTMAISVTEQREQIGILRALGWTRNNAGNLIFLEALTLGLTGSTAGLLLGNFLAVKLVSSVSDSLKEILKLQIADVSLSLTDYALIGAAGVLSTLLFAYIPVKRTEKINPLEAMKKEFPKKVRRYSKTRTVIAGVLLLVSIALVHQKNQLVILSPIVEFIGLTLLIPPLLITLLKVIESFLSKYSDGICIKLGASSFRRTPRRAAVTGMPIFFAFAISFSFLSLTNSLTVSTDKWVKEIIASDIVVHQGVSYNVNALSGLSDELLERITSIDGVDYVFGIKTDVAKWNGKTINIQAIDIEGWSKNLEFTPVIDNDPIAAVNELGQSRSLWVSELLAKKYDLETEEIIKIDTPSGTQDFKIIAINKDFQNMDGSFQINRQDYLKYWGSTSLTFIDVFVKPDYTFEQVQQNIKQDLEKDFNLKVDSAAGLREDSIVSMKSLIRIADMVVLISIIVSFAGIFNTLLISAFERSKEIGTLRSLGMSQLQIIKIFIVEVGILLLATFILSIPTAFLIFKTGIIYQEEILGLTIDSYIPWIELISLLLSIIITALIITTFPAWKAAKNNPTDALRTE